MIALIFFLLAAIGAVRVIKLTFYFSRRILARTGRLLATLDDSMPDAIAVIAKQRKVRS